MEIIENSVGGHTIVSLGGQIDSTAAIEFEEKIIELIDRGTNTMIIDFAKVKFISSAGLRVLLLAAKKLKPYGGKIVLCALAKDVQEVFDISGFSSLFSIYVSTDEAIQKI